MGAPATYLFTREVDLLQIQKWKYKVEDKTCTTRLYSWIWNALAKLIPRSVAPNVLTITAMICILQAFWVTQRYACCGNDPSNEMHSNVCYGVAFLFFSHMTLDALDGIHARNTHNTSPLGEFVDHGCDNIAGTYLVLTLLLLVGVEETSTLWYLVHVFQLISLSVHIRAFGDKQRKIRFGLLTGPGELMHVFIALVIIAGTIGKDDLWHWMSDQVLVIYRRVNDTFECFAPSNATDEDLAIWIVRNTSSAAYWIVYASVVIQVLLLKKKYFATKFGIILSLAMRSFIFATVFKQPESLEDIAADGLFLSIICSDIIIAKMANRDLHSLVPVIAMTSIISNSFVYFTVALYHCTVIFDICAFLNLPLLNPVINVYCDGVFDLLHLGHKLQFEQALKKNNGTRLIVGVLSDATSTDYKRKPILTEQERYASVAACKYVHKVVEDAPLITDKAFIEKHQIHIFAVGEEYVDDPNDKYYEVARKLGILRATERTDGISTSDLIRRIESRDKAALGRKEPAKKGI